MIKILIALAVIATSVFPSTCDDLYNKRGESLSATQDAFSCLEKSETLNKMQLSSKLNNMAYLKFFEATYFENDSLVTLVQSYEYSKESVEVYGKMFDIASVRDLGDEDLKQVALAYYLYGTSVSKYVDLKGKWEAIKRMSEIKDSMKMILSLKQPSTFHYGAYRNLAIFNLKVPSIAGGSMDRSKIFFERLMSSSKNERNISSYAVGHIYYAEYLIRVNRKADACKELDLVKSLNDSDINTYFKDLIYETKKDQEEAIKMFKEYSC